MYLEAGRLDGGISPVTAAFFISLREGLEAALIVGIIAAYLVKLGRRDALRGVWVGVGAAVTLSIVVGALVVATVGRLPLAIQESIEGVAAVFAVVVLTWMLFWMRRQGRAMKGELEHGVDMALAGGSMVALAGLAFVSVAREGLETVLFLFAIGTSSGPALPTLVAAVAGLAAAVAIGWAIFAAGIRIDLRRFFNVTGIVLIFVSAGLVAFAVHEFGEAGLIANAGTAFDLGSILPESSPIGALLAGLFGYRSTPTPLEVIGYLAYLIPVLIVFLRPMRRPAVGPATAATAIVAMGLVLAGCGGTTASPATSSGVASGAPGSSTEGVIKVAASEYKFEPATIATKTGSVTFEVTNVGTTEHEFEIFKGETVVDEIEGLVPGLTRQLTVTLDPGEYTYLCKLAAHDTLGMKGALTVAAN
jgi:high-affinity iron transporter